MVDQGKDIQFLVEIVNCLVDPRNALRFCRERFERDGELERFRTILESLLKDEQLQPDKRKIIRLMLDEEYQKPESW